MKEILGVDLFKDAVESVEYRTLKLQDTKDQQVFKFQPIVRDCELYSKLTFIFRKKSYLSRKYSVAKFLIPQSRKKIIDNSQTKIILNIYY